MASLLRRIPRDAGTWFLILGINGILLMLPAGYGFAKKLSQVDYEAAQIQRVVDHSKKLQKLITEARAGTSYRIRFAPLKGDGGSVYQGFTSFFEGQDRNGITVHVTPGLSHRLTEILVAHELFHIVLYKEGWPIMVRIVLPQQGIDPGLQTTIMNDASSQLINCYSDALIDSWMSKQGYRVKLLNHRQYEQTIQQANTLEVPPPPLFDLWRKDIALINYCLSIRPKDFRMKNLFNAYRQLDSHMSSDQRVLEQKVIKTLKCDDVPSCIEATKKLREAAGFEGLIYFKNPITGKDE